MPSWTGFAGVVWDAGAAAEGLPLPQGEVGDASAAVGDGFGVVGGTLRTDYPAVAALEGEGVACWADGAAGGGLGAAAAGGLAGRTVSVAT